MSPVREMESGEAVTKVIDVGRNPLDDYVVEAIVGFQEGPGIVVLKGRGPYISKAVDVYNALADRLGDGLQLVKVEIGTERHRGRLTSFIAISVKRKY